MCLPAIPLECTAVEVVEGTSWSKLCRAEAGQSILGYKIRGSGNGGLCLVSSITCIHVFLDEMSSQPVCSANALNRFILELIKLESNLLVLFLVL